MNSENENKNKSESENVSGVKQIMYAQHNTDT